MRASMRSSAEAYREVDMDRNNMLSFDEFVKLPASRHKTVSELREEFVDADKDGSGFIDKQEYLRWSLLQGLASSHKRVAGLFAQLDADGSSMVSKVEFRRAVRSLHFGADTGDIDRVFEAFDEDGSGEISVAELTTALTPEHIRRNLSTLRMKLSSWPALSTGAKPHPVREYAAAGRASEQRHAASELATYRSSLEEQLRQLQRSRAQEASRAEAVAALLADELRDAEAECEQEAAEAARAEEAEAELRSHGALMTAALGRMHAGWLRDSVEARTLLGAMRDADAELAEQREATAGLLTHGVAIAEARYRAVEGRRAAETALFRAELREVEASSLAVVSGQQQHSLLLSSEARRLAAEVRSLTSEVARLEAAAAARDAAGIAAQRQAAAAAEDEVTAAREWASARVAEAERQKAEAEAQAAEARVEAEAWREAARKAAGIAKERMGADASSSASPAMPDELALTPNGNGSANGAMVTPRDLARLAAQRGAERESRAELAAAQRQWLDWISSPRSPLPLRSPRSAGSGGGAATASRSSLGYN